MCAARIHRVEVLTRSGCCLCEKVIRFLEQLKNQIQFELVVTDISSSLLLTQLFRWEIPVVKVDGVIVFKGRIDLPMLEAFLLGHGYSSRQVEGPDDTSSIGGVPSGLGK